MHSPELRAYRPPERARLCNEPSTVHSSYWAQICEFVPLSVFTLFKHLEDLTVSDAGAMMLEETVSALGLYCLG